MNTQKAISILIQADSFQQSVLDAITDATNGRINPLKTIEINDSFAKLREVIAGNQRTNTIVLHEIQEIVFEITGATEEQMRSRTRKREIVMARQAIMSFYRRIGKNISLREAGEVYDKDHATVLHSIKTMTELNDTSKQFRVMFKPLWTFAINEVGGTKKNFNLRVTSI